MDLLQRKTLIAETGVIARSKSDVRWPTVMFDSDRIHLPVEQLHIHPRPQFGVATTGWTLAGTGAAAAPACTGAATAATGATACTGTADAGTE